MVLASSGMRNVVLTCGWGVSAVVLISCQSPHSAPVDAFDTGEYHIERVFKRRVTCVLDTTVQVSGVERATLEAYAPDPPTLPSQSALKSTLQSPAAPDLACIRRTDDSPLRRGLLELSIPINVAECGGTYRLRSVYELDLYARDLSGGRGLEPPPELDKQQRRAYLSAAEHMDFDNPAFRDWLNRAELKRARGERELAFGHRVFRYLTDRAIYAGGGDYDSRKPSVVCNTLRSDCGGLSMVLVATMRANGVPARTLFGRWALPQEDEYGQYHVIAEFYASEVGWVPVDVAGAIIHYAGDPDRLFGHADGLFVAFHEDTDIRIGTSFGAGWAQYLLLRWPGKIEVSDTWRVTAE